MKKKKMVHNNNEIHVMELHGSKATLQDTYGSADTEV